MPGADAPLPANPVPPPPGAVAALNPPAAVAHGGPNLVEDGVSPPAIRAAGVDGVAADAVSAVSEDDSSPVPAPAASSPSNPVAVVLVPDDAADHALEGGGYLRLLGARCTVQDVGEIMDDEVEE